MAAESGDEHDGSHPTDAGRELSPEPPSTLPQPLTSLIGREHERGEVLRLFDRGRLVTLVGSGGCGKTRLAIALGDQLRAGSPDGVWWIDLAAVADPSLVAGTFLAALGSRAEGGVDPAAALVASVAERQLTLVVDNAEHLLDECTRLLALIVDSCPSARVLVTSREPIGLQSEWTYRVPSLGVPEPEAPIGDILTCDSVRLFEARANQARLGFAVSERTGSAVTQICRRLDGIPLAIELAAVWVRALSVDQIAEGLDDRFRLLAGGGRRAIPRQQTLLASVEWSYGLLDDDERRCLRRLSVFVGGFTLEAAEAVVADTDLDRLAVRDLVLRLVDKSVVLAPAPHEENGGGGQPRFGLLETLRQFGLSRLEAAGETHAARDLHLAWVRELAARAEPELTGRAQGVWLDRLEDEHDNVRAAADWAAATADGGALWDLAARLAFFWVLHGHFTDARHVVGRALELADGVPSRDQLAGRWSSAYVALYAGDYERGYVEARDLIDRARAVGDDRILGRGLDTLATIEMFVDLLEARRHLEEAIPLARAAGDEWCLSDALQIVGYSYLLQGAPARGDDVMREARAIADRLDNQQLLGWDHFFQGCRNLQRGLVDAAQLSGEATMRAAQACGDPAVRANALILLSDVAIRRGQAAPIVPLLLEAVNERVRVGGSQSLPALTVRLAATMAASGRAEEAMAILDGLDGTAAEPLGQFDALQRAEVEAHVALALGRLDIAAAAAHRSQELARAIENDAAAAISGVISAWIALQEGRLKEADQSGREAVARLFDLGYVAECTDAVRLCGLVAAACDRPIEATRLLAAAQTILEGTGALVTHVTAAVGQPDTTGLEEQLGAGAFHEAWDEGALLSLDAVAELVARSRGSRRRPALGWDSLTPTELSVVELAAEGLTNKAIASRLFVSPATVKTHLAHVFAKLDMANRAEVTAEVIRRRHR